MLSIRNAKPLLALTTLFVPWDFFMFGRDIGWGLHFPFGRFAQTVLDTQFIWLPRMLELSSELSGGGRVAIVLWVVASAVTGLAVLYAVGARFRDGTVLPSDGRRVGLAFAAAGVLFVISRFLMHDFLLVSGSQQVNWFSIPVGAAYTIVVGGLFYYDRF